MAKDDITIRVLNTETQKVKFLFPSIANNKQLMKNMKCVISDPQYEAKMEAFKSKKPFSENGKTEEPVKEAFATPIETKPEVKIEQPKNEIKPMEFIIPDKKTQELLDRKINEPKGKRVRRTKAQMLADKQSKNQLA